MLEKILQTGNLCPKHRKIVIRVSSLSLQTKTMSTKRVGILTEFNYEDLEVRKRFMYVNVMSHLCFYRIHMRTTTFSNI